MSSLLFVSNAVHNGQPVDILVHDEHIERLVPHATMPMPEGAKLVVAEGRLLFPSCIDAHTHLREPGQEYKEDIASGLTAAAHGGFADVLCMANTIPTNDSASVTRLMLEKAQQAHPHGPRLHPIGALTLGLKGVELAPLGELSAAGCIAFSNDGCPVADTERFRRGMEYAATFDRMVIDHCEDPFLAHGAHCNEGVISGKLGIKGQPPAGEAIQVARDILLAEYLQLPIHLAHISTKQSVELIAWAKSRGVAVTAETCPHYLLLDERALEDYDTAAKVNPPLRTQEDVQAVRKALADGTIDILVTDHAPHAPHEKEVPLDTAPNGMIGLETAMSLSYQLVMDGTLSLERLIAAWHYRPAQIFSLETNDFTQGAPANFFLFNPQQRWLVNRENLHSKSSNTPFFGKELAGKVCAHWIRGKQVI